MLLGGTLGRTLKTLSLGILLAGCGSSFGEADENACDAGAVSTCGPIASGSAGNASAAGTGGSSGGNGTSGNGGGASGSGGSLSGGGSAGVGAPMDSGSLDAFAGSTTIATGRTKPTGIALTATDVLWAEETDGTIVRCPKAGCGGAAPTVVVSGQTSPHGIAISGSTLYWVTSAPDSTKKCVLGTCDPGSIVNLMLNPASGPRGNTGITVSATTIYISGGPNIWSCPIAGCGDAGSASYNTGMGPSFGLAVGPSSMFFTRAIQNAVRNCPLTGCPMGVPEPTLASPMFPFAVAVDATNVYWSEFESFSAVPVSDGAIRTCPLAGCTLGAAKVLAGGAIRPFAIAVDASSIFYTDYMNGRVERTAKSDSSHTCVPNHLGNCEACAGVVKCNGTCTASCTEAGGD